MSPNLPLARLAASLAVALSPLPSPAGSTGDEESLIAVRRDEPRNRTWILDTRGVALHEAGSPVRRFVLPGWVHLAASVDRDPDLVVEAGGAALVSSNILPDLWRIEPEASRAVKLAIEPRQDAAREVGFTDLRPDGNGGIEARGTLDRAAWHIDVTAGRAARLAH